MTVHNGSSSSAKNSYSATSPNRANVASTSGARLNRSIPSGAPLPPLTRARALSMPSSTSRPTTFLKNRSNPQSDANNLNVKDREIVTLSAHSQCPLYAAGINYDHLTTAATSTSHVPRLPPSLASQRPPLSHHVQVHPQQIASQPLPLLSTRAQPVEPPVNAVLLDAHLMTLESHTEDHASMLYAKNTEVKLPRDRSTAPIYKLTTHLIDTYLHINQLYYTNKKKRRASDGDVVDQSKQAESKDHLGTPSKRSRPTQPPTQPPPKPPTHPPKHAPFDDADHNYRIHLNEIWDARYNVHKVLGKGSFGQVVEAYDSVEKEWVAIKIIKNRKAFYQQALMEIRILEFLNSRDRDDTQNIVRLKRYFEHRQHLCLVYELLSFNLYDLLKNTHFKGVSLQLVQQFAIQILTTLAFLATDDVRVIHCDLKPENVLLRNPHSPLLKVVDFGSSCFSDQKVYSYIQSRFYRAPEILLGVPYNTAIDMWSLGCMLVEMHTGQPLFNGSTEHDQVCRIHEILGTPPHSLLAHANQDKLHRFFVASPTVGNTGSSQMKYTLIPAKHYRPRPYERTLSDIIMKIPHPLNRDEVLSAMTKEQQIQYDLFIDFINSMLRYDPLDRVKPQQALKHPFLRVDKAVGTPSGVRRRSPRLAELEARQQTVSAEEVQNPSSASQSIHVQAINQIVNEEMIMSADNCTDISTDDLSTQASCRETPSPKRASKSSLPTHSDMLLSPVSAAAGGLRKLCLRSNK